MKLAIPFFELGDTQIVPMFHILIIKIFFKEELKDNN